jgi:2-keto-4-pentenoate hydratase
VQSEWAVGLSDDDIARTLLAARAEQRTLPPISASGELSLERAYAIQQCGTKRRLADGQRIIGWKLGYTSLAMRKQMAVTAPNFGPLFNTMVVRDYDDVGNRFTQPKVEPEIAVVMGRDIADPSQVRGAVVGAYACLEIVDSVFTDYTFTLADNTADGSSAAGVVCGLDLRTIDLASIEVELIRNGETVATANGAAASDDPLSGVEWLAEQLLARGERLHIGDFVITGGLTAACDLAPGTTVEGRFTGVDDNASATVRRL